MGAKHPDLPEGCPASSREPFAYMVQLTLYLVIYGFLRNVAGTATGLSNSNQVHHSTIADCRSDYSCSRRVVSHCALCQKLHDPCTRLISVPTSTLNQHFNLPVNISARQCMH